MNSTYCSTGRFRVDFSVSQSVSEPVQQGLNQPPLSRRWPRYQVQVKCSHTLRVETDRWLIPKPPREQPVCRHCTMQAIEDEQHFLFDCPIYSIIRGQHQYFSLFGPNYQQRNIRLFFEQNAHQLDFVAHHIHLCFQARMSDESHLAPHPRL